jgi:hypothetical protein
VRKTRFIVIVGVALFVLVHSAHAQFGRSAGPRFYSDFTPVVGAWSEYQMTGKGEEPTKMKIAIVGQEGEAYWYETVMELKGEGRMVSKMLVAGNPQDRKNVKRVIVKMGDQPAMEMPAMMHGSKAPEQKVDQKGKVTDKGTESIKVPAGTFTAQHMQYQDGERVVDSWISKQISPYGLIKSQAKDFEMVLLGYGAGAKTLITETPQKFEMPQMPSKPR